MREIVFDTETTGLDAKQDRIIEIGCLELVNRFPTGRTFHHYINPDGRPVHADAFAVHGISDADLADKPLFRDIVEEFRAFVDGARLVAHNAGFDTGFINAELARLEHPATDPSLIVDTLAMARRKHPMGPNSLDALCRRYGIDNSRRTRHGALLDAEILAEVYIEMIGGKQAALGLEVAVEAGRGPAVSGTPVVGVCDRPRELEPRLSDTERSAHEALVARLGENSIWRRRGLAGGG